MAAEQKTPVHKYWEKKWTDGAVDAAVYPLKLIDYDALRGKRVLEVGCGELECSPSRHADMELVGVDISMTALRGSRRHNPAASLLRADARYLPFPNNSFDCVIANETLSWLGEEVFIGLGEVARVCKPGGRCMFTLKHIEIASHHRKLPEDMRIGGYAVAKVDKDRGVVLLSENIVKEAMKRLNLEEVRFVALSNMEIAALFGEISEDRSGKKEGIFVDAVKE